MTHKIELTDEERDVVVTALRHLRPAYAGRTDDRKTNEFLGARLDSVDSALGKLGAGPFSEAVLATMGAAS